MKNKLQLLSPFIVVLLIFSACNDPLPPIPVVTLTMEADSNGSVSPDGAVMLDEGQSLSIQAIPATGYSFASWEVVQGNGVTIENQSDAATTVTQNAGDATIRANFVTSTYTLTLLDNGYGSISPTGVVSAAHGEEIKENRF